MEQIQCKCGNYFNSREYISLNETRFFHCKECFALIKVTVNIEHTSQFKRDADYYELEWAEPTGRITHPTYGPISPKLTTRTEVRKWWVSYRDELVTCLEVGDEETLKEYRSIY